MAYLLGDIISMLDWSYATAGRALGRSLANIGMRVGRDSEMKLDELYKFHRYAEEQGWSNKVELLSPLMQEVMPEWDQVERMLFRYIGCEPWHHLDWFLASKEDIQKVCDLLNRDVRPTVNMRYITVFTAGSRDVLDELHELLCEERALKMRFDLEVYQSEDMPFLSTKLRFGETLLQFTENGFVPDVGRGDKEVAEKLVLKKKTLIADLVGEVRNVAVRGTSPPAAADGNAFILDFTGQLGGLYRLQCTWDDVFGEDGERRWHMRLSAVEPCPVDQRNIEVLDQGARVVISTHSDNLPWLGFWPDNGQPLELHKAYLLFSEFKTN